MFIGRHLIYSLFAIAALYACGAVWAGFYLVDKIFGVLVIVGIIYDLIVLYGASRGEVKITRILPRRMSCGDESEVKISVVGAHNVPLGGYILDELPVEFQKRDLSVPITIKPSQENVVSYMVRPTARGDVEFANVNLFVYTPLRLIERRYVMKESQRVSVFPSFHFIRDVQLSSPVNRDRVVGSKIMRRRGQSTEYDTIREYVTGDDYRSINWRASSRRSQLMVNQYCDETCQDIISVIDKGRGMRHVFDGVSLMDHAINATIRLSYSVIEHHDNAGVLTFEKNVDSYVAPSHSSDCLNKILLSLYADKTSYAQSDYSKLMQFCQVKIQRRSLFIIYTTFESMDAVRRQIPFLKHIASRHAVLVVFFEDEDMAELAHAHRETNLDCVTSVLAHSSIYEKRLIVNELRRYGIFSMLTNPQNLSGSVINRYIELKRHHVI